MTLRLLLQELERFGKENDAQVVRRAEKMLNITPETGEFLAILVLAMKARRVLEIGTSNGYSTLWLADAVRTLPGSVTTAESSPEKARMAGRNFERAGLAAWIRQHVGEAGEFLRGLPGGNFDLVFLDADRTQYVALWPQLEPLIVPGGLVVVDNAISHAPEMADFLEVLKAIPRYRTTIVPVGNGELLAHKAAQQGHSTC